MSTLTLPQQNDQFSKAIWASLLIHIALIMGFSIKTYFFESEPMIYENAVRVDLVALPDKMTAEQMQQPEATPETKKPDAKAEPKTEITKPILVPKKEKSKEEAINLNKTKSKQSDALKKLKEMEALEKIKRELETQERMKKSAKLFKGNQISTGSELSGVSKIQHDNYIAGVKRHIYQNWALPEWLSKKELSAQVLVRFDEHGNIIFHQIYKSSGNGNYDDAIIEAVQKSSPAPAPPEKLVKIMKNEGILIGFPE